MPRKAATRASLVGIAGNCLLLTIKAAATGLSDSLTIFSETLNSLSDVVSSVAILLFVRWAWKSPDETHPFGHRRAEPIAALLVSIFAGILGFEVCRTAVIHLWNRDLPERIGPYPIAALIFTLAMKAALTVYFLHRGRLLNSPALRATAIDCRNDVLVAAQGLLAVVIAEAQVRLLDAVAALVIGLYIFYSAVHLGMENIDYLMGKAPADSLLERIRRTAASVPGVQQVDDIRGHYVGTFVHVELTARVNPEHSTLASHDIGEAARRAVESMDEVDRAFVHVEPIDSPPHDRTQDA